MSYEEFVERRRVMAQLSTKGWSVTRIGDKYGITRQMVSLHLKKAAEEGNIVSLRKLGNPGRDRRKIIDYRQTEKKIYNCVICSQVCPEKRQKTCSKECQKINLTQVQKKKNLRWSRHNFIDLVCFKCKNNFQRSKYLYSIAERAGCLNHYCGRKCYESRNKD
jgi:predicted transcriptional regulator